jgi:hypothetical protein
MTIDKNGNKEFEKSQLNHVNLNMTNLITSFKIV